MTCEGTTKFSTGAVRSSDREGVRYDLITPIGLKCVAEAYAEGSKKYADFNWEKGMPVSDILNHAVAHIYAYLSGDRSEKHLGHAAWNLLAACHSDELWPHLNKNLRGPGCKPPVETIPEFHVGQRVVFTPSGDPITITGVFDEGVAAVGDDGSMWQVLREHIKAIPA